MADNSVIITSTDGHEAEVITVQGAKASFQKFKDDKIGILGNKPTEYYTQAEAVEYNAALDGALNSTDPLTAEQASAYNTAITGGEKQAGDTLSAEEAAAYNATLEGSVEAGDPKPTVQHNVKSYVDGKLAIVYDPTTKGMVYPADTSRVQYDPTTKGMVFH